ncbi:unnamed protein product [Linum trigynum]
MTATTTTFVSSYKDSSPACLPPGDKEVFNYQCSVATLPGGVQEGLLGFIDGDKLVNPDTDVCTGDTVSGTAFTVYVGCNRKFPTDPCKDCVNGARTVMRKHCPDAAGAQAAARHCCVRYETYKFCT